MALLALLCSVFFATVAHADDSGLVIENSPREVGRLAFTLSRGEKKGVFVLDFALGTISPIVETRASDEYPSWSPDGRHLAFYSDICGNREIFTIHSDGTEMRRITFNKGVDEDPNWSPDGEKIVYFESDQTEPKSVKSTRIVTVDKFGKNKSLIYASSSKNTVPKWSPRGDEIIFSTNQYWPGWDISIFSIGATKPKTLTGGLQSYCRASWHPDGGSFVFSYGSGKDIDLWIQAKGDAEPRQLTRVAGREYDGVFTEDGKGVFFASEVGRGAGKYQIHYVDVETREEIAVTSGTGSVRHLSWTPLPALPTAKEIKVPQQGLNSNFIRSEVCEGEVLSRNKSKEK